MNTKNHQGKGRKFLTKQWLQELQLEMELELEPELEEREE